MCRHGGRRLIDGRQPFAEVAIVAIGLHWKDTPMPSHALYDHVPVDKYTIGHGPGRDSWSKLLIALQSIRSSQSDSGVEAKFTLRTYASQKPFDRKLIITKIDLESMSACRTDSDYPFSGRYRNQLITGIYNSITRTGWFTPA